MPYIDPIDALDGSTVTTQSWPSVVERYSSTPAAQPIMRLAAAIAASPYGAQLFPVTSMFDIRIYAASKAIWNQECLLIQFDFGRATFCFEFIEHAYVKPKWTKSVPVDEAFSAFIHFLVLKRWFPVTEIERGSWSCDNSSMSMSRSELLPKKNL